MKIEVDFVPKGLPRKRPILKVVISGEKQTVETVLAAVRKAVEEELPDLEELAYVTEELRRKWGLS